MKYGDKNFVLLLSAIALVHLSCDDMDTVLAPGDEPGSQSNDRITITNDENALEGRVRYFDDKDVPIDSGGGGGMPKRGQLQAFSLKLVAEVLPPSIDGQVLQATSISMKNDKAIISYNMRGGQYLGGIDIFDTKDAKKPKLKSEALFNDSDINSISLDEGNVYAVGATGSSGFPDPAVLEVIKLKKDKLVLEGNQRVPLTSFAGTGVVVAGNTIYAISGDNGGISVFDQSTLTMITSTGLHDARWVDAADGNVVVVQGTPGQISVFSEGGVGLLGTYSFTGADIPESKSTVEVVGGKAFIAAGSAGVQIISVNTGTLVGTVPRPDPASLGLDPSVVVTNAVGVDDDLLFISNGEAGVYVAQGSKDFSLTGSEEPQQITLLGKLRFDDLQSVNHVAYKGKKLIIASGLGGLKIIEIRLK